MKFSDLELAEPLLRAVSDEGYTTPTPVQAESIPHVLAGRDLLSCAQTGTGKTAAFALPLIDRLLRRPAATSGPKGRRPIRVLVLAPTRELAGQILGNFRAYGRHAQLKSLAIYGGVSQNPQAHALARGVDILVATPGRLLDLIQQRLVDLQHVEALVLDEADRMLDMGFLPDIRRILKLLPQERQTLLFSATIPAEIRALAADFLRDPVTVQVARESSAAVTIRQGVHLVGREEKIDLLLNLLHREAISRMLIFTRTRHGADKLQRKLQKAGHRAEALHGDKSQSARERIMREFRSDSPPLLVATDVAARGLDVELVSHVVNFDMPHEPETYVHRIGRTGRAGMEGVAISFCDRDERAHLRAIERLIRTSIPVHAVDGTRPAATSKTPAAGAAARPAPRIEPKPTAAPATSGAAGVRRRKRWRGKPGTGVPVAGRGTVERRHRRRRSLTRSQGA